MASLGEMVKRLLRLARVSNAGADDGQYPVQQVSYLGKVGDAVIWLPYGFHANIPADELAVLLSLQGNTEARVAMPGSAPSRPKPLAAGELVIYHPPSGSKIHFKANGDIDLETVGDLNATVAGDLNATISGAVQIDAAGDVVVDSSGGDVTIEGGEIFLGETATEKLLNETALATYNAHTHFVTGGNTAQAVTGGDIMVVDTDTTTKTMGE